MNWFAPIDQYCERLGPGFWAEPLNAVSNAAFIIAAAALFAQWQRLPHRPLIGLLLIVNVFAVGIGSFLFHTFANRWSELADVIPIAIFIHGYLLVALRTYLRLPWWQAAGITLGFALIAPLLGSRLAYFIGTSAYYVPALLAIFGVAIAADWTNRVAAVRLRDTGLVFALSIALRSADQPFCDSLPIGTHLFWHLFNALVLFLLVQLYLRVTAAPGAR
jgi:hypothetical protein